MAVSQRERERKRVSARQRAETHKTGYERTSLNIGAETPVFKLDRAGTRRVDVIPYRSTGGNPFVEKGELSPERTYFTHRGIGPNNDTFVCPAKTAKKPCPICEYRSKLQRDPDADEKLIQDLAPKERQLWNVIDLEEPEKGVQLWDISFHLFGKLLDAEIRNADEGDEYEFYADPTEGMSLKLGIAEKSFAGNTFYEVETIGFKTRREQYDEDIVEKAHPLDKLLIVPEYEKFKAVFLQTEKADEGDEENQEATPPLPAKKSKDKEPAKAPRDRKETPSGLLEGQMVKHRQYGKCEVVRISSDGTSLTLEDADGGIHKAVEPSEVRVIAEEPKMAKAPPEKPKAKPAPKPPADEDDWDDEPPKEKLMKAEVKPAADEDEDEDEEPVPKKKTPPAKAEADDWDDEEPVPKKEVKAAKIKPADEDDWN